MNDESTISNHAAAFGLSLAVCSVLNALLVVAKEKSKAVSDAMQKLTGHHWITHVAIVLILFVALGFLFGGRKSKLSARCVSNIIVSGVVAGLVIILGFYLVAD